MESHPIPSEQKTQVHNVAIAPSLLSRSKTAMLLSIWLLSIIASLLIGVQLGNDQVKHQQASVVMPTKTRDYMKFFPTSTPPEPNSSRILKFNPFFYFEVPKPLSNIDVLDLPGAAGISNIIEYKNHLWFVGDGSIKEYDIENGKLISYSNRKKANCDRDVVLIDEYIYATCRVTNDTFGTTHQPTTKIFTGDYGILKINPNSHEVERVFERKDGLLDGENYTLYQDGNDIWIGTYNGVGRINTKTNKVNFYRQELSHIESIRPYSIVSMLIDKEYVWVFFYSHIESKGGAATYSKKNGIWKDLSEPELNEHQDKLSNLYIGSAKLIPGGIQIAFSDRSTADKKIVEKQFNYESGIWKKVGEYPGGSGLQYEETRKLLESTYPSRPSYYFVDTNGLTQIRMPGTNKTYELNGRGNRILSPVFEGKRYILTGATIDVLDNSAAFPQIYIPLEKSMFSYHSSEDYVAQSHFFIDPQSLLALVIDSDCEKQEGCTNNQQIQLVDLKNKKTIKLYSGDKQLPAGNKLLPMLTMTRIDKYILLSNEKNEEVLRIDTDNYDLTFPKEQN